MKQIPVDECPAGGEMDAAVAKVRQCTEDPKPSIDPNAAWELMKVSGLGKVEIITFGPWSETFLEFGIIRGPDPLAITRAYLKVKGVEFVEVPDETNTG